MSRANNEAGQNILIAIVVWGVMMLILWSCDYFTSASDASLPARPEKNTPIQYTKFDEVRFAKYLEWAEQTILSRRGCVKYNTRSGDWHIYTEDNIASCAVSMAMMRYKIEIGML